MLAKCPAETPEQKRARQFWQLQFTDWRDLLAGDTLAVSRAVIDCALFNRSPPFSKSKRCTRHSRQFRCPETFAVRHEQTLAQLESGEAGTRTAPQRSTQLHSREGAGRRCLGGGGKARGGQGRQARRRDGEKKLCTDQARRWRADHVAELQARGG